MCQNEKAECPTADFLLTSPELVTPVAPWCVVLDNLELGIVLLAQPWVAGEGLRRAQMERQLERLSRELPVGPVYFQRISRAVAKLEESAVLRGEGSGRARRFLATAQGFGALVLNLRVLRADPTLDGSEFELKRALVAMCTLLADRFGQLGGEVEFDPELESFFDRLEALEVWGQPVITDEVCSLAFDVLQLIATQRRLVQRLLEACQERLAGRGQHDALLRDVDLAALGGRRPSGAVAILSHSPEAVAAVRELATIALPELSVRAATLRYRRYLAYLDDLAGMYAGELRVVSLHTVRRLAGRGSGASDAG